MGLNAPASAGLIHDVFAEYEKTFGMARRKQKTTRSAPHDCQDSGMAAGSIPQPIRLEAPRAVTDDGVTSVEQPTEVTRDDVGPRKFSRELENGFTSQLRQENNQQGTQTEDIRSKRLLRFASDCCPGKFYNRPFLNFTPVLTYGSQKTPLRCIRHRSLA